MDKAKVLKKVKSDLVFNKGYTLSDVDEHKPWGTYYKLADQHAEQFIKEYFPSKTVEELGKGGSLSPKFLIFEPGKRLSLQYHNRRAEIWRVIQGDIEVALSDKDEEGEWKRVKEGDELSYDALVRHRAGAPKGKKWAVVAEIWQHTDMDNPTDEEDIIRLADDFGRA